MFRKALAIVLAICMAVTILPAAIFAETPAPAASGIAHVGNLNELQAAIANADVTTIIADRTISLDAPVTIDGGGKTIRVEKPYLNEDGTFSSDSSNYLLFDVRENGVTLQNMFLMGGNGSTAGAIVVNSYATLRVENVRFSRTYRPIVNRNKLICVDCSFDNNAADYGGACLNFGTAVFDRCSFVRNRAIPWGGGAIENQSKLYVNNCTFVNNVTTDLGSAISTNKGSTLYMMNSTVTGNVNSLSRIGGAISATGDSNAYIVNSIISGNYNGNDTDSILNPDDLCVEEGNITLISSIYSRKRDNGSYKTTVSDSSRCLTDSQNIEPGAENPGFFGYYHDVSLPLTEYDFYQPFNSAMTTNCADSSHKLEVVPNPANSAMSGGAYATYLDYSNLDSIKMAYRETDTSPVKALGNAGFTDSEDAIVNRFIDGSERKPSFGIIGASYGFANLVTISGTVSQEKFPSGADPVGGASVELYKASSTDLIAKTVSRADGTYTLYACTDDFGTYNLTAKLLLNGMPYREKKSADFEISESTQEVTGQDIRLDRGSVSAAIKTENAFSDVIVTGFEEEAFRIFLENPDTSVSLVFTETDYETTENWETEVLTHTFTLGMDLEKETATGTTTEHLTDSETLLSITLPIANLNRRENLSIACGTASFTNITETGDAVSDGTYTVSNESVTLYTKKLGDFTVSYVSRSMLNLSSLTLNRKNVATMLFTNGNTKYTRNGSFDPWNDPLHKMDDLSPKYQLITYDEDAKDGSFACFPDDGEQLYVSTYLRIETDYPIDTIILPKGAFLAYRGSRGDGDSCIEDVSFLMPAGTPAEIREGIPSVMNVPYLTLNDTTVGDYLDKVKNALKEGTVEIEGNLAIGTDLLLLDHKHHILSEEVGIELDVQYSLLLPLASGTDCDLFYSKGIWGEAYAVFGDDLGLEGTYLAFTRAVTSVQVGDTILSEENNYRITEEGETTLAYDPETFTITLDGFHHKDLPILYGDNASRNTQHNNVYGPLTVVVKSDSETGTLGSVSGLYLRDADPEPNPEKKVHLQVSWTDADGSFSDCNDAIDSRNGDTRIEDMYVELSAKDDGMAVQYGKVEIVDSWIDIVADYGIYCYDDVPVIIRGNSEVWFSVEWIGIYTEDGLTLCDDAKLWIYDENYYEETGISTGENTTVRIMDNAELEIEGCETAAYLEGILIVQDNATVTINDCIIGLCCGEAAVVLKDNADIRITGMDLDEDEYDEYENIGIFTAERRFVIKDNCLLTLEDLQYGIMDMECCEPYEITEEYAYDYGPMYLDDNLYFDGGTTVIHDCDYGIASHGGSPVFFRGGDLNITGTNTGISAYGDIHVTGGSLHVETQITGIISQEGRIYEEDGTVYASAEAGTSLIARSVFENGEDCSVCLGLYELRRIPYWYVRTEGAVAKVGDKTFKNLIKASLYKLGAYDYENNQMIIGSENILDNALQEPLEIIADLPMGGVVLAMATATSSNLAENGFYQVREKGHYAIDANGHKVNNLNIIGFTDLLGVTSGICRDLVIDFTNADDVKGSLTMYELLIPDEVFPLMYYWNYGESTPIVMTGISASQFAYKFPGMTLYQPGDEKELTIIDTLGAPFAVVESADLDHIRSLRYYKTLEDAIAAASSPDVPEFYQNTVFVLNYINVNNSMGLSSSEVFAEPVATYTDLKNVTLDTIIRLTDGNYSTFYTMEIVDDIPTLVPHFNNGKDLDIYELLTETVYINATLIGEFGNTSYTVRNQDKTYLGGMEYPGNIAVIGNATQEDVITLKPEATEEEELKDIRVYVDIANNSDLPATVLHTREGYELLGYYTTPTNLTEVTTTNLVIDAEGMPVKGAQDRNGKTIFNNQGKWVYDDDLTLYASWRILERELVISSDFGGENVNKILKSGDTLESFTLHTRTGYSLKGYSYEKDGQSVQILDKDGKAVPNARIGSAPVFDGSGKWAYTKDLTVKAQWTPNQYTVTLKSDGQQDKSVTATYDAALPPFPAQTKSGFVLEGYYTAATGGVMIINGNGTPVKGAQVGGKNVFDENGNWVYDDSLTLYAQWTTIEYALTLKSGYLNGPADIVKNMHIGDNLVVNNMHERTGYTLNGYFTAEKDGQKMINSDGTTVKDNVYFDASGNWKYADTSNREIELYAQWTPKTYSVTLKSDKQADKSITATYDAALPAFDMHVKTDCILNGYFTEETDGKLVIGGNGTPMKDVQINGKNVFDENGNWIYEGTLTLYAQWTLVEDILTLKSGTDPDLSLSLGRGMAMPSVAVHIRKGYTLTGYFTDEVEGIQILDGTGRPVKGASIDGKAVFKGENWAYGGDLTLYAQWAGKTDTITLKNATTTDLASDTDISMTATYGSRLPSTDTHEKEGFFMDGYYTEPSGERILNGNGTAVKGAKIDGQDVFDENDNWIYGSNLTLYAHWTDLHDALTLHSEYGRDLLLNMLGGNALPPITAHERDGYELKGYYADATGTNLIVRADGTAVPNAEIDSKTVFDASGNWAYDGHLTVFAQWTAKTYTLTQKAEFASESDLTKTVTYDAVVPKLDVHARTGYNLNGYFTTKTGSTKAVSADGSVQKNVSFGGKSVTDANGNWVYDNDLAIYAQWLAKAYTLTLKTASATDIVKSVSYDGKLPTVKPHAKTGYALAGYYADASGTNLVVGANGTAVANAEVNGLKVFDADGNWIYDNNLTLFAKWQAKTYHVTLKSVSQADSTAEATYKTAIEPCTVHTKSGYSLNGYYTETVGGTLIIDKEGNFVRNTAIDGITVVDADGNWVYDDNLTLYAQWTGNPDPYIPSGKTDEKEDDNQTLISFTDKSDEEYKTLAISRFTDVPEDSVFAANIGWAVDNQITEGMDETHFNIDGSATRAQAAVFLWRMAGCPEPSGKTVLRFTDLLYADWYIDALTWCVENGIIAGRDEYTFDPEASVSREELALMIHRLSKLVSGEDANGATVALAYDDTEQIQSWAKDAICWATTKGIVLGYDDNTFRPGQAVTRGEIVTMLRRYAEPALTTDAE